MRRILSESRQLDFRVCSKLLFYSALLIKHGMDGRKDGQERGWNSSLYNQLSLTSLILCETRILGADSSACGRKAVNSLLLRIHNWSKGVEAWIQDCLWSVWGKRYQVPFNSNRHGVDKYCFLTITFIFTALVVNHQIEDRVCCLFVCFRRIYK